MSNSPDLTIAAIKMLVSLVVVLAIIWGLYRVAKKSMPMAQGMGKGRSMQILESQYLGLKKNITMVRIPGAVLVLGVTADRVNLLSRIDDPAIIQGIMANADDRRSVLSFKEQLQKLGRFKSFHSTTDSEASAGQ